MTQLLPFAWDFIEEGPVAGLGPSGLKHREKSTECLAKRSLSVAGVVTVSGPVVAAVAIMVTTDVELLKADGVRDTSSVPPQQLALRVVRATHPLVTVRLQQHTGAEFISVPRFSIFKIKLPLVAV